MDIKELDKKQLILLTLLITFVVSIGTGIVTVSLMKQMPKSVPQTINNVIQRTIEKVTTVQVPTPVPSTDNTNREASAVTPPVSDPVSLFGSNADALVSVYLSSTDISAITSPASDTSITTTDTTANKTSTSEITNTTTPEAIGQGIIVSDIGLVLVDSNLIKKDESYKVLLNKIEFSVSVLKKFENGFTILKISPMTDVTATSTEAPVNTQ